MLSPVAARAGVLRTMLLSMKADAHASTSLLRAGTASLHCRRKVTDSDAADSTGSSASSLLRLLIVLPALTRVEGATGLARAMGHARSRGGLAAPPLHALRLLSSMAMSPVDVLQQSRVAAAASLLRESQPAPAG